MSFPSTLRCVAGASALALLSSFAHAQVSTASVQIGGDGAYGCQGASNPPTLTGGVLASATVDYSYDQATQRLTLTVDNTSAIVAGESTPLLTRLFGNTPPGAIDGMTLVSQTAADGTVTDFALQFGAARAGCLGVFDYEIGRARSRRGIYGIAVPGGNGNSPSHSVDGPVTFEIDVSGPGAANVNARAFAYGFSENDPRPGQFAGAKFQDAGVGGAESGWLGNDQTPDDCATSMWVVGDPVVGGRIDFCRNGQRNCHDCLSISLFGGPTQVGNWLVPIGFPLLAVIDEGFFDTAPRCITYDIPNDPVLSGVRLHFVIATYVDPLDPNNPQVTFGDGFSFEIR